MENNSYSSTNCKSNDIADLEEGIEETECSGSVLEDIEYLCDNSYGRKFTDDKNRLLSTQESTKAKDDENQHAEDDYPHDSEMENVVKSETYILLEFPELRNLNIFGVGLHNILKPNNSFSSLNIPVGSSLTDSNITASVPRSSNQFNHITSNYDASTHTSKSSCNRDLPTITLFDLDSDNPTCLVNEDYLFKGTHLKTIGTNLFFRSYNADNQSNRNSKNISSDANINGIINNSFSSHVNENHKSKIAYKMECNSCHIIRFEIDASVKEHDCYRNVKI